MLVVLGLDNGDRQIGLVVEDVVCPARLASAMQLAAHDDAALGEGNLFAHLALDVPTRLLHCRGDELGANVPLAERLHVHVLMSLLRLHGAAVPGRAKAQR